MSRPTRLRGIRVGRRFTRLHLLHCSEFSGEPGEPAAKVVLHGVDGKDDELVVRYGVHFQDWSYWVQGPMSSEPDTHCAWMAPPRDQPDNPWLTTLWHTVLLNPRPEVEVGSLEVRSLFSQVRYTLIAVTTETGSALDLVKPRSAQPMPHEGDPTVVRFRLMDADDGSPVGGARVQASVLKLEQLEPWDSVTTDAQGDAFLDFPSSAAPVPIEILAAGPKHMAAKFSWQPDSRRIQVFSLHRGQTVGGKVVDDSGRAVPGVTITIAGPQDDGSGRTFLARWPDVMTDANGLWSLGCAPPDFSRLIITLHHSKLLPAVIYEQDETAGSAFSVRGEDLAERKAVFRVKPGMECGGSVRCTEGPVAGARVTLFCGEAPDALHFATRTDKEGRFAFAGLEPGPASLVVVADGFAPALQSVALSTNAVAVTLEPGRTLQAIAQDESAHPLAQTLFQVTLWKGRACLEHFGYSDAAGRFQWDSAPAGSVTFCVFHPGFHVLRNVTLSSETAPKVLILQPQH